MKDVDGGIVFHVEDVEHGTPEFDAESEGANGSKLGAGDGVCEDGQGMEVYEVESFVGIEN